MADNYKKRIVPGTKKFLFFVSEICATVWGYLYFALSLQTRE